MSKDPLFIVGREPGDKLPTLAVYVDGKLLVKKRLTVAEALYLIERVAKEVKS